MPFSTAALHRHIRAAHKMLPVEVSIGGVPYTGTKTTVNLENLFLDEGKLAQYQFSVSLSQWDFRHTTLPANGDVVTIATVEYRVLGKQSDAGDISTRIDLGSKHQRGK